MLEHLDSVDGVRPFDIVGLGIGPFNLSLAALLEPVSDVRVRFFDRASEFNWHPGLILDNVALQSPFIKDCVTLIDPTSKYSFLNYLARTHRLNRFIVSDYINVPRWEYNAYFRWVCSQLATLEFRTTIESVRYEGGCFVVGTNRGSVAARDLAVGLGREPYIPPFARVHLGATVYHGSEYLFRTAPRRGQRIVVVGGGQTGAEIVNDIIKDNDDLPGKVTWITRRHNFLPFDESPFANEIYVPGYTQFFWSQPPEERERLLPLQRFSSDGIVLPLLLEIYRRLYTLDFRHDRALNYRLLTDREMIGIESTAAGWQLAVRGPSEVEFIEADLVILATGFEFSMAEALRPLSGKIDLDDRGRWIVEKDFSLRWDGPPGNRIFVHNMAQFSHGWSDPNFASMAWRSAVIVNSLTGRNVYDTTAQGTTVDWSGLDGRVRVPVSGDSEKDHETRGHL
jgi:lysine N6-hydroxylase